MTKGKSRCIPVDLPHNCVHIKKIYRVYGKLLEAGAQFTLKITLSSQISLTYTMSEKQKSPKILDKYKVFYNLSDWSDVILAETL